MTPHKKKPRGYMEIVEDILKACPGSKTNLWYRAGLVWVRFNDPRYLPLILEQGLIKIETNNVHAYTVKRGANAYLITSKGERYLKLMKEAKELLGLGG